MTEPLHVLPGRRTDPGATREPSSHDLVMTVARVAVRSRAFLVELEDWKGEIRLSGDGVVTAPLLGLLAEARAELESAHQAATELLRALPRTEPGPAKGRR